MTTTTANLYHPATPQQIDRMLKAYVHCARWSSSDTPPPFEDIDGNPIVVREVELDQYEGEMDYESLQRMRADCEEFLAKACEDFRFAALFVAGQFDITQIAHDLWLTRNDHGAGFWDRNDDVYPEPIRDLLTDLARRAGERSLYIGDDGLVHQA